MSDPLILPQWERVASEYRQAGAEFPLEAVSLIVFGDLGEEPDGDPATYRGRFYAFRFGMPDAIMERLDRARQAREDLGGLIGQDGFKPEYFDALTWQIETLAKLEEAATKAALELRDQGWYFDRSGNLVRPSGGGRPISYYSVLIGALYRTILPVYRRAWPKDRAQNPARLRRHISELIRHLFPGRLTDPVAHAPLHIAIRNAAKKRSV